ncbi:hypothetical protein CVT25_003777 [Psilocybe cyanescens]|uniref:Uncharacterized protein n=1 Tax=Psilocybe cyanescens TaxID=93625 RepID=A0A409WX29_PSICY|nr:hypothetical protein CVT25_003777 [Psilocybe cyanescens]
MALAQCLAEILPIHLNLFSTGDLVDVISFLPHYTYVPSEIFLSESASQDHLNAVAVLSPFSEHQSCDGLCPCHTLVVRTASLITYSTRETASPSIIGLGSLSTDALWVLVDTLESFLVTLEGHSQVICPTTYTSSYTHWFLTLSARIIASCSLSDKILARHAYILSRITSCSGKRRDCDNLFYVASIYVSNITTCAAINSSPFWNE